LAAAGVTRDTPMPSAAGAAGGACSSHEH